MEQQRTEPAADDYLFQLPADVTAPAVPLVGVTGLDIVHHATHYLLWHILAEDRSSDAEAQASLKYIHVRPDHEFPPKKSKRSYEMGGQVHGLFKSNWFHKHLYELPAVICHFVDLEWDNPAFEEKEIEVSSKIRTLRAALMGRGTQFCLCLIQSKPSMLSSLVPVPLRYSPSASGKPTPRASSPSQTEAVNERHASLARACDIPFKQIFIICLDTSLSDGLAGKASGENGASGDAGNNGAELQSGLLRGIRHIEPSLTIAAYSYFANETKRVRAQRDNFQRVVNSSFLLIRHQIKQAFYQEMRQEKAQAVQYYRVAHLQLKDVRITPAFMHEVKTIAMILMYKICRLLLSTSDLPSVSLPAPSLDGTMSNGTSKQHSGGGAANARDAIDHFKAYRAHYKTYQGVPELEFEHEAWLCRQHLVFADLLARACEIHPPSGTTSSNQNLSQPAPASAVRLGKHEHPGIFYREAATHCQRRKFLAHTAIVVCGGLAEVEQYAGVSPPLQADFYGQRRVLKQVSQPPALYQFLLAQETRLNYARLMIALLSKALLFYRHMQRSDSRRIQWMLLVMIGDEYTQVNEYELALTYLSKALNEYQQERWYDLVGRVAPGTLNCAIRSANLIEFVLCSLTLQSIRLAATIRTDYCVNVWKSLQQLLDNVEIPDSVRLLSNDAVENAWKQVLTFDQKLLPLHVRIDAHTTCAPLFELDAAFTTDSCTIAADEVFKVLIAVRSLCRAAFVFHSARVTLVCNSADGQVVRKNLILNGEGENAKLLSFDAVFDAGVGDDRLKSDRKVLLCSGSVIDAAAKNGSVVKLLSQAKTFHINEVCLTHKCASKKFILHWIWQFPDLFSEHSEAKGRLVDAGDGVGHAEANSSATIQRWRVPSSSMLLPINSVRTCRVMPRESKLDIKLVMPTEAPAPENNDRPKFLCYGETIAAHFVLQWSENVEKVAAIRDLRMNISAVANDDDDDDDEGEIEDDENDDGGLMKQQQQARAESSSRASVETVRPASRSILASPLLFAEKDNENFEIDANEASQQFDSFIKLILFTEGTSNVLSSANAETKEMLILVNRPRLSEEQQQKLDVDEDDADQKPATQTVKLVIRGSYLVLPATSKNSHLETQPVRIYFVKRIEFLLCEAFKATLQLHSNLLFKRPLSWQYIRSANRSGMIQPHDELTLHLKLANNVVTEGVQLLNFTLPSSTGMELVDSVHFPLNIPYQQSFVLNFRFNMQQAKSLQVDAVQSPAVADEVELGICALQWKRSPGVAEAPLDVRLAPATSSVRLPTLPLAHVALPFVVSLRILNDSNNTNFGTITATAAAGQQRTERLKVCELRRPMTCVYVVKSVSDRWQEFASIALEPVGGHDFLISGAREWHQIQLAPHQVHSFSLCFVPMRNGHVSLPKLIFKRASSGGDGDDVDSDDIDDMVRNMQNEVVFVANANSL